MRYQRKAERITERQRAIIVGLSVGLTVEDIAARMELTKRTLYRDLRIAKNILSIKADRFAVGELVTKAANANLDIRGYTLNQSGRIVSTVAHAVRG